MNITQKKISTIERHILPASEGALHRREWDKEWDNKKNEMSSERTKGKKILKAGNWKNANSRSFFFSYCKSAPEIKNIACGKAVLHFFSIQDIFVQLLL